jgi:hypothetical protein
MVAVLVRRLAALWEAMPSARPATPIGLLAGDHPPLKEIRRNPKLSVDNRVIIFTISS